MGKKLYVGNLSFGIDDNKLRDIFAAHGQITSAKVIVHRDSGRSKGFGFVEMPTDSEADAAIQALNSAQVEGRPLTVSEARPQVPRQSTGSYNGTRNDLA